MATFEGLASETAPDVDVVSSVCEQLLERAMVGGIDDPLTIDAVRNALVELGDRDLVVCTCSTIGGVAESVGADLGRRVVRVDRPMAEKAVRLAAQGGGRVVVAAAVESTLAPTFDVLESVIDHREVDVAVEIHLVDGAWERFEAGDQAGYIGMIANALPRLAEGADVVVLAQASMAEGADATDVGVPVLSSPRLAVESLLG